MSNHLVYMDNNATTPMAQEVIDAVSDVEREVYGNASSMHSFGRVASALVDKARISIANLLDCEASKVVFTSGASESNNTVFMIAKKMIDDGKKRRIITSTIEHPSIKATVEYFKKNNIIVDLVPVDKYGIVKIKDLRDLMSEDVALVSVMTANNETGSIQDVKAISEPSPFI